MPAIVIRDDRYGESPELYRTLNDARAAVVLKILDDPYALRDDDLLKIVLRAIEAGDFADAIDARNEAQGGNRRGEGRLLPRHAVPSSPRDASDEGGDP